MKPVDGRINGLPYVPSWKTFWGKGSTEDGSTIVEGAHNTYYRLELNPEDAIRWDASHIEGRKYRKYERNYLDSKGNPVSLTKLVAYMIRGDIL